VTTVASPDVFAAFYDSTVDEVYRYLLRAVLGDRALAEDLTQETFASVVLAVRDGRAEAYAIQCVIGVARHNLVDHYRNASREVAAYRWFSRTEPGATMSSSMTSTASTPRASRIY
jgi:RNA polymerase sigma-70 factor (ECF subfamily)